MLSFFKRKKKPPQIPAEANDSPLSEGTPHWAVEKLVVDGLQTSAFILTGHCRPALWHPKRLAYMRVWDPACGSGDIERALGYYFREVKASDPESADEVTQVDLLDCNIAPFGVEFIISRPPADQVWEFCQKARAFAKECVALLIPYECVSQFSEASEFGSHPLFASYKDGYKPLSIHPLEDRVHGEGGARPEFVWITWTGNRYPRNQLLGGPSLHYLINHSEENQETSLMSVADATAIMHGQ